MTWREALRLFREGIGETLEYLAEPEGQWMLFIILFPVWMFGGPEIQTLLFFNGACLVAIGLVGSLCSLFAVPLVILWPIGNIGLIGELFF